MVEWNYETLIFWALEIPFGVIFLKSPLKRTFILNPEQGITFFSRSTPEEEMTCIFPRNKKASCGVSFTGSQFFILKFVVDPSIDTESFHATKVYKSRVGFQFHPPFFSHTQITQQLVFVSRKNMKNMFLRMGWFIFLFPNEISVTILKQRCVESTSSPNSRDNGVYP